MEPGQVGNTESEIIMRRSLLRIALHLVLILLSVFSAHAAIPRTPVATVERVSDGDTVTPMSSNGTKLRIRLLGIGAPEIAHGTKPGQPFGEETRDYLDHLIGGKVVRLDIYGVDRYKRLLAVVWDDQINLNLLMVAMGYAEFYRGAPRQVHCRELEQAEVRRGTIAWACGRRLATRVSQPFAVASGLPATETDDRANTGEGHR